MTSRELNIEIFPIFRLCITFLHYLFALSFCITFLVESHKGKHEEKHEGKHEEEHKEKHKEEHEDRLIESFDRRL